MLHLARSECGLIACIKVLNSFLFLFFFYLYKLDEGCVHGACLGPLLITAWGLSLVFSSSFRFMAWITAISLASFFWFLASNSNLNQTKETTVQFCSRYNRRQATVCPFTRLWTYRLQSRCTAKEPCSSSYLFLIILCTIASVVRLFPLSTVRSIPFLRGS